MNSQFEVEDLGVEGVKIITPFYIEDDRGYFLKNFEKEIFAQWGLENEVFEDFESYSKKGVIRGMHFQTRYPQIKFVRAIKGTVHDIIVDIRKDSPTFGKFEEVVLSENNHQILWVPRGFAHGFEVLSDDAIMSYKCVGKYLSGYDTGIIWSDKELELPWSTNEPIVSDKDAGAMTFAEFCKEFGGLEV